MMHDDDDLSAEMHALNTGDRSRPDVGTGPEFQYGSTAVPDRSASLNDDNAQFKRNGISSRLLVPTADGTIYLPCEGIIRLMAEGSYTHIYTEKGERYLTCKGLGVLHANLPKLWFYRCHNAHVINLVKVRKLLCTGGYRAQMLTGDLVEVSRRKWRTLKEAMGSLHT